MSNPSEYYATRWDLTSIGNPYYKLGTLIYFDSRTNAANFRIAFNRSDFRGRDCSFGGYDGHNCYVGTAPSGTTAFISNGKFCYTPLNGNQCPYPGSTFDGANCFVTYIPESCDAFIYNNKWYVKPDIIEW
jgi:hypothetical protein